MQSDLTNEERQRWARTLYIKQEYGVKETAQEVNVDESVVLAWAEDGQWETVRRSLLTSKNKQLRYMYDLLENLNARMGTNPDSVDPKSIDIMVKYTAAIKNLEGKLTLATVVEVFEQFLLWLGKKDIALARQVTPKMDTFVKQHLSTRLAGNK